MSYVVPASGLPAWRTPDGTHPPVARLDPGLEVGVAERRGDWARVVCSNGWEGWVDGRQLVARAPASTTQGVGVGEIGLAALLGAAFVLVGGFLDWWKVAGVSFTAWDIPVRFLLTGDAGDGVKTGPFLLVVVVVALPLVTRRPLPSVALLGLAAVPTLAAVLALVRGLREDPSVDPRLGLLLTLGGGALIMVEAVASFQRRGATR